MCQVLGIDQRPVGKQHAELVAAQARRDRLIEGGRRFAQHRGDPAQQGITGRMPVTVVDVLEAIQITDQQRRKMFVPIDLGEPFVERAAVGQVGEGIPVCVSPDRGEEFPAADRDRGVGGDRLQQRNIVMAEAPARDAGCPDLPPHRVVEHHRHGDFALLARQTKVVQVGRGDRRIVDGVHVGPPVLQQAGDVRIVGDRVDVVVGPALVARLQVPDVDQRAQGVAVALPPADGQRRGTQRGQRLLGDDFEDLVEVVGAQYRIRDPQHRAQYRTILGHRDVDGGTSGAGHANRATADTRMVPHTPLRHTPHPHLGAPRIPMHDATMHPPQSTFGYRGSLRNSRFGQLLPAQRRTIATPTSACRSSPARRHGAIDVRDHHLRVTRLK